MKRTLVRVLMITAVLGLPLVGPGPAAASKTPPQPRNVVLVDNSTQGIYNDSLGKRLDGTGPQFPCADLFCGDPTHSNLPPPDLSSVSDVLGGWLQQPPWYPSSWTLRPVPSSWAPNTETAIVYRIDSNTSIPDVVMSIGVDNGVFVWVNGAYKRGAMAPGPSCPAEYVINLGTLPSGTSHIQILREDHGGLTGFHIKITGWTKDYTPPAPC